MARGVRPDPAAVAAGFAGAAGFAVDDEVTRAAADPLVTPFPDSVIRELLVEAFDRVARVAEDVGRLEAVRLERSREEVTFAMVQVVVMVATLIVKPVPVPM